MFERLSPMSFPSIVRGYLQHDLITFNDSFDYTPAWSWTNPTIGDQRIRIEGDLNLQWNNFTGGPIPVVDVDIVLLLEDFSAGTTSLLVASTLSTPVSGDTIILPVLLEEVDIGDGDGDRIILSFRGQALVSNSQVMLRESLVLTLLPEPSTALLLGLAISVVSLWHRRG